MSEVERIDVTSYSETKQKLIDLYNKLCRLPMYNDCKIITDEDTIDTIIDKCSNQISNTQECLNHISEYICSTSQALKRTIK